MVTVSVKENGVVSNVVSKLVTKEDPVHLHKSIGILCLLSYVWRFSYMFEPSADFGFARYPQWTLVTVLLHLFLNVSSFEFNIPARRISSGYRIWPEYRLHSLVFLARSLSLITIYWHEDVTSKSPNYWWNALVIIGSMAAADAASSSVTQKSPTIRNLEAHPLVRYFFSFMQFCATANCLYGLRRYTMQFYFVMIIQCNAFFMTLRRKNLLSHEAGIFLYGVALATGLSLSISEFKRAGGLDCVRVVALVACSASLWRMGPWKNPLLQNKYLIWAVESVLLNLVFRPSMETDSPLRASQVRWLADTSVILVILYGIQKCLPKEATKIEKQ